MSADLEDSVRFDVNPTMLIRRLRHGLADRIGFAEKFGPSGLRIIMHSPLVLATTPSGSIIVTQAAHDGDEWIHASIARANRMPTYDDLCTLKEAVWGPEGEAYQAFVSASRHVNIHPNALHLWGRADGSRVLPEFGAGGSI